MVPVTTNQEKSRKLIKLHHPPFHNRMSRKPPRNLVPGARTPRNPGVTGVRTPGQQQNRGATCLGTWSWEDMAMLSRKHEGLHGFKHELFKCLLKGT